MAESEGFEPSKQFPAYSLSRGAPSATRPTLRGSDYSTTAQPTWFLVKNKDKFRLNVRVILVPLIVDFQSSFG
jgi:hypothetical protein